MVYRKQINRLRYINGLPPRLQRFQGFYRKGSGRFLPA